MNDFIQGAKQSKSQGRISSYIVDRSINGMQPHAIDFAISHPERVEKMIIQVGGVEL